MRTSTRTARQEHERAHQWGSDKHMVRGHTTAPIGMASDLDVRADAPHRVRPGDSRQRDYLANERTLLAWIRTAVGLFAFGAAIGKLGSDLASLHMVGPGLGGETALTIGVAFIIVGVLISYVALWRYAVVQRDIAQGIVESRSGFAYVLALGCGVGGSVLLVYLLLAL